MQNAFTAVGCILLIGLAGAAVYLLGWVRNEHLPLLSDLVIKVALPCMIVSNVLGQYTPESLAENLPALASALSWDEEQPVRRERDSDRARIPHKNFRFIFNLLIQFSRLFILCRMLYLVYTI